MKIGLAIALVLLVRLSAAISAEAQAEEAAVAAVPMRVELGVSGGLMAALPEVGMLASLPAGPGSALEVGVSWMPNVNIGTEYGIVVAQFRIPFRAHLRSRRSLLIGATRIAARSDDDDYGFWGDDARIVFPHAGVSLQWPIGKHADFRLDALGLFTFDGEFPMVPRAVSTFVWHPRARR